MFRLHRESSAIRTHDLAELRVRCRLVPIGICVASLMGCGQGLFSGKFAPVAGVIRHEGKPLTRGTIMFIPVNAASTATSTRIASSSIQPDGKFRLSTELPGDGAIAGEYNVIVMPVRADGRPTDLERGGEESPFFFNDTATTEIYTKPETTPLSVKVAPGVNLMDLDLRPK